MPGGGDGATDDARASNLLAGKAVAKVRNVTHLHRLLLLLAAADSVIVYHHR